MQIQFVGQAIGYQTQTITGYIHGFNVRNVAKLEIRQIVGHSSDENAGPASFDRIDRQAGVVQGVARVSKNQLLLRIHPEHLTLRDMEQLRVESIFMRDIPASYRYLQFIRHTDEFTTMERRITDPRLIRLDQAPIGVKTFSSWKMATHTGNHNHGDSFRECDSISLHCSSQTEKN